jgi:hypothetical protein
MRIPPTADAVFKALDSPSRLALARN